MKNFINEESELFKITFELMKKYNLASHHYQDWVDPSEYEDDFYINETIDTCNRLYRYHDYYDIDENIETVKEIFYFWGGNNATEDTKMLDKIKLFVKDLIKEYRKIEKIQDK